MESSNNIYSKNPYYTHLISDRYGTFDARNYELAEKDIDSYIILVQQAYQRSDSHSNAEFLNLFQRYLQYNYLDEDRNIPPALKEKWNMFKSNLINFMDSSCNGDILIYPLSQNISLTSGFVLHHVFEALLLQKDFRPSVFSKLSKMNNLKWQRFVNNTRFFYCGSNPKFFNLDEKERDFICRLVNFWSNNKDKGLTFETKQVHDIVNAAALQAFPSIQQVAVPIDLAPEEKPETARPPVTERPRDQVYPAYFKDGTFNSFKDSLSDELLADLQIEMEVDFKNARDKGEGIDDNKYKEEKLLDLEKKYSDAVEANTNRPAPFDLRIIDESAHRRNQKNRELKKDLSPKELFLKRAAKLLEESLENAKEEGLKVSANSDAQSRKRKHADVLGTRQVPLGTLQVPALDKPNSFKQPRLDETLTLNPKKTTQRTDSNLQVRGREFGLTARPLNTYLPGQDERTKEAFSEELRKKKLSLIQLKELLLELQNEDIQNPNHRLQLKIEVLKAKIVIKQKFEEFSK